MEGKMKLEDIEVNFSFTDADDVERFENAAKKVYEEAEKNKKKEMNASEIIREECNIIEEFFDSVFGEGISNKLFNEKKDIVEHIKLFEDIVKAKVEATKDIQNIYDNIENSDRYKPNRETRRYNNYKGRK